MSVGEMEYLPPVGQSQQSGALKYTGEIAQGYDAKRQSSAKWQVEQKIIESMLADLPPGSSVLDCPFGTGRFLELYLERNLKFIGGDMSGDMLFQAVSKLDRDGAVKWVNDCNAWVVENGVVVGIDAKKLKPLKIGEHGLIKHCNVLSSGAPDQSVDAVLNIRISRWLTPEQCQQMFTEMMRISRDRIILTARVSNHQFARPLALFEAVMTDEWELARSECGASGPAEAPVEDKAYRIFMFRRKQAVMSQPKSDDAWVMNPYEATK